MKQTKALMGTTITIEIADHFAAKNDIDRVFSYFESVEKKFSVFKPDSEITLINDGKIKQYGWSKDMNLVFELSEKTKQETKGYFDIVAPDGKYNPSGLVKGWAIYNASKLLKALRYRNFYVEAGGDIQAFGQNIQGESWSVGIKNPFNHQQIVKVVYLKSKGIATSGTYLRGQHIYDPHNSASSLKEIVSISVIGPNIYEADRFATAAFAMGQQGILFVENLNGFEGYMINKDGLATETSGFEKYTGSDQND
ncbi:MAG: FAD:protein FMN transferase [Candidatus Humimicrobiaceae bacterium]